MRNAFAYPSNVFGLIVLDAFTSGPETRRLVAVRDRDRHALSAWQASIFAMRVPIRLR